MTHLWEAVAGFTAGVFASAGLLALQAKLRRKPPAVHTTVGYIGVPVRCIGGHMDGHKEFLNVKQGQAFFLNLQAEGETNFHVYEPVGMDEQTGELVLQYVCTTTPPTTQNNTSHEHQKEKGESESA